MWYLHSPRHNYNQHPSHIHSIKNKVLSFSRRVYSFVLLLCFSAVSTQEKERKGPTIRQSDTAASGGSCWGNGERWQGVEGQGYMCHKASSRISQSIALTCSIQAGFCICKSSWLLYMKRGCYLVLCFRFVLCLKQFRRQEAGEVKRERGVHEQQKEGGEAASKFHMEQNSRQIWWVLCRQPSYLKIKALAFSRLWPTSNNISYVTVGQLTQNPIVLKMREIWKTFALGLISGFCIAYLSSY